MNVSHPTLVLIKGANWLGAKLIELLLEQKANVVVVDDFTEKNMPFVKRFSDSKNFVFIERDKIETLRDNFDKIKYIIHLKHDLNTSNDQVSSKNFLAETKFADEVLSLAVEKKSTYLLCSSLHLHKDFILKKSHTRHRNTSKEAYTESDLQDFVEKTVMEYIDKAGLDGRIARLGNVYGPEMDLDADPLIKQIITDAVYEDQIRIFGDGLEYMYYVYVTDAIQGIVKALFRSKTHGKIFSITNPDEVSILTIINKVLALGCNAQSIRFLKRKSTLDPLYQKSYIPDENLTEIGWKPNVSFDKGIAQLYQYFKNDVSLRKFATSLSYGTRVEENDDTSHLKIEFDETVNLSHGEHGIKSQIMDKEKFRDFYEKLNSDDSPIYNKRKSESPAKEQRQKKYIARKITIAISLALAYLFLAAPIFQVISLDLQIKEHAEELNSFKSTNFTGAYKQTSLADTAKVNILGIQWLVNLLNKEEFSTNVVSVASGIDYASQASLKLAEKNFQQTLLLNDRLPEQSVPQAQEILLLLNSAQTHLSVSSKVNLPFGGQEEIQKILNWTYEIEDRVSLSLSQQGNIAETDTNENEEKVLGIEDVNIEE